MFSPIKDQIDGTSAYASSGTQQYENISMSAMKEVPKRKKKSISFGPFGICLCTTLFAAIVVTIVMVPIVIITRRHTTSTSSIPSTSTLETTLSSKTSPKSDFSTIGLETTLPTTTDTTAPTMTEATTPTNSLMTTKHHTSDLGATAFKNGGFETGNVVGWIRGGGNRSAVLRSAIRVEDYLPGGTRYDSAVANEELSIVNPGMDPKFPNQIESTVRTGNYALRIGNTIPDTHVSVISQQIDNYLFENIYFSWLAVLQADDSLEEASIFIIELRDITQGDIAISKNYSVAISSTTVPSIFRSVTTLGHTYYYTNWQTEQLAIDSSRKGHSFRLTVLVADCTNGGHLGYMYVDNFGDLVPQND